jgi:hypothetical protein
LMTCWTTRSWRSSTQASAPTKQEDIGPVSRRTRRPPAALSCPPLACTGQPAVRAVPGAGLRQVTRRLSRAPAAAAAAPAAAACRPDCSHEAGGREASRAAGQGAWHLHRDHGGRLSGGGHESADGGCALLPQGGGPGA